MVCRPLAFRVKIFGYMPAAKAALRIVMFSELASYSAGTDTNRVRLPREYRALHVSGVSSEDSLADLLTLRLRDVDQGRVYQIREQLLSKLLDLLEILFGQRECATKTYLMGEVVLFAVDPNVVWILRGASPASKHICDSQEIRVAGSESLFGRVGLSFETKGSDEWRFRIQGGSDSQGRIKTPENSSSDNEFTEVYVHGQFGQDSTHRCDILIGG
jgi:hypothetical protein